MFQNILYDENGNFRNGAFTPPSGTPLGHPRYAVNIPQQEQPTTNRYEQAMLGNAQIDTPLQNRLIPIGPQPFQVNPESQTGTAEPVVSTPSKPNVDYGRTSGSGYIKVGNKMYKTDASTPLGGFARSATADADLARQEADERNLQLQKFNNFRNGQMDKQQLVVDRLLKLADAVQNGDTSTFSGLRKYNQDRAAMNTLMQTMGKFNITNPNQDQLYSAQTQKALMELPFLGKNEEAKNNLYNAHANYYNGMMGINKSKILNERLGLLGKTQNQGGNNALKNQIALLKLKQGIHKDILDPTAKTSALSEVEAIQKALANGDIDVSTLINAERD